MQAGRNKGLPGMFGSHKSLIIIALLLVVLITAAPLPADLAVVTWERYQVLTKTGAVSRQAGDTQLTYAKTGEANVTAGEKNVVAAKDYVRASQAALDRLLALQAYEKVTSPFNGIVTARN